MGETTQPAENYDTYVGILSNGWLRVTDKTIEVVYTDSRDKLRAQWSAFSPVLHGLEEHAETEDDAGIIADFRATIEAFLTSRNQAPLSLGGGRLHKSLHKSLHKALHKGLHKGLHKAVGTASGGAAGYAAAGGMSWPEIEVPWRELGLLYKERESFAWDKLPLEPPPDIEQLRDELEELRRKQEELKRPEYALKRARIEVEATNDLTAYMLPLGSDVTSSSGPTAVMFQTILWLGSLIGQMYKARFGFPRPHVLDPRIEPYIPVPAYSSYPSNHAFQSFLIAEVIARSVPEHGGAPALQRAAQEVAENREWAGLHTKSDTEAGRKLARLCAPVFERVLRDHIRAVRAELLDRER